MAFSTADRPRRARLDRWSLVALGLLLAGTAVRAALAFPVHKHPTDADALLSGLCAFQVLRGEMPVFQTPLQHGSLECHAAAAAFALFGPSRAALAAVVLLMGALLLLVAYGFFRELLDRRLACLALLFLVFPSPSLLFWTAVPNGYPMTLLLCAAVLWLAARLGRAGGEVRAGEGGEGRWVFAWGLAAGLGLWQSFQTLGATVASGLCLAWRRRDLLRRVQLPALALAGFLLGATPWLAFNVRWSLGPLQADPAAHAASGVAAVGSNLAYFVTYSLPELVASVDPENASRPLLPVHRLLRSATLAIYGAAFLFFLLIPLLRRRWARLAPELSPAGWALLLLAGLALAGMYVFSQAGQLRGLTVRYVLPLALVAAPVLAIFLAALQRASPTTAALGAATVVALGLAGYPWPGREIRDGWRERALVDERVLALLAQNDVDVVVGGYWTVYPFNFLSGERIRGLACEPGVDPYKYEDKLPASPQRWALAAWTSVGAPTWIERLQEQTALEGRLLRVAGNPGYVILLPQQNPPSQPPREFLAAVRGACAAQPY